MNWLKFTLSFCLENIRQNLSDEIDSLLLFLNMVIIKSKNHLPFKRNQAKGCDIIKTTKALIVRIVKKIDIKLYKLRFVMSNYREQKN